MADMDAMRRFVREAQARGIGDDEARMAWFRQELEAFLTPDLFRSFDFTFE